MKMRNTHEELCDPREGTDWHKERDETMASVENTDYYGAQATSQTLIFIKPFCIKSMQINFYQKGCFDL